MAIAAAGTVDHPRADDAVANSRQRAPVREGAEGERLRRVAERRCKPRQMAQVCVARLASAEVLCLDVRETTNASRASLSLLFHEGPPG
eukprot:446168-Pyramimonas_sp.AAC.1